ncbi:hypothetical protein GLW07_13985 [Bacillus hwajinpoensis]|uniref:DUF3953 domain-containing protein n=1 Tax=Guptibacillus hwajinpoensis TaxID=208199 RepID=A0A845F0S9_9BACL|nr:hypothetical protein [Pseudalkalibacillus hwajinpoensis]MYL64463.1 hypothetical protein [Pseudalkalibacillus hwajinpoensis]
MLKALRIIGFIMTGAFAVAVLTGSIFLLPWMLLSLGLFMTVTGFEELHRGQKRSAKLTFSVSALIIFTVLFTF